MANTFTVTSEVKGAAADSDGQREHSGRQLNTCKRYRTMCRWTEQNRQGRPLREGGRRRKTHSLEENLPTQDNSQGKERKETKRNIHWCGSRENMLQTFVGRYGFPGGGGTERKRGRRPSSVAIPFIPRKKRGKINYRSKSTFLGDVVPPGGGCSSNPPR